MYDRDSRRRREEEKLFEEIISGTFSNMGKELNIQVKEAQNVLNKVNLDMYQNMIKVLKI